MEQGIPTAQAMTIDPDPDRIAGPNPAPVDNLLTREKSPTVWARLTAYEAVSHRPLKPRRPTAGWRQTAVKEA